MKEQKLAVVNVGIFVVLLAVDALQGIKKAVPNCEL